jgi:Domain of unknown function (DUF4886)
MEAFVMRKVVAGIFLWTGLILSAFGVGAENLKMLMIGNSYTARSWDQIDKFLAADPEVNITISRTTPPGETLAGHYDGGRTLSNFLTNFTKARAPWDIVVLQEQSQRPAEAVNSAYELNQFLYGGTNLAQIALDQGAKVILYETWARRLGHSELAPYNNDPIEMQDRLTQSYNRLGSLLGIKVAPVGEAWEDSILTNPRLELHAADGSHPNTNGAYLAAAVFYEIITGKDCRNVNYVADNQTPEEAAYLRNIAHNVLPQPNVKIDPILKDAAMEVSEEATPGTVLTVFSASPFSPEVPIRNYSICEGSTNGWFSINPSNGTVQRCFGLPLKSAHPRRAVYGELFTRPAIVFLLRPCPSFI